MSVATGLYIHIPFCRQKCGYCDFASFAGQESLIDSYLSALEQEAAAYSGSVFDTLYVGGGTPSLLSVAQLNHLCNTIEKYFGPISSFTESTLEANPESISAEKLALLQKRGFNRISMGVQSFHNDILKRIGRIHTVEMFLRAYEEARKAGFENINIDLIAGLPTQTEEQFIQGVKEVIYLQPEHVSVYALQVEEGTPFYRQGVQPDEELVRREWEQTHRLLLQTGYHHYEISNFAREGRESRHNTHYWLNGAYVGLGSAAASYQNGVRRSNTTSLTEYLARMQQNQSPVAFEEKLTGKEKEGEQIMIKLQLLDGIHLSHVQEQLFAAEIATLKERGLVEQKQDLLKLTFEGMFVANQAFMAFVAPFDI